MTGIDNPAATGGLALVSALGIQYLKNSGWATWFNRETDKANLFLSLLVAFFTSLGIHFSWDAKTDTIAIIGVMYALQHGLWEWFIQWAAQHVVYKTVIVQSETLGEIRAYLARLASPPPISEGDAKTQFAEGHHV
jgi:hypothetical protein